MAAPILALLISLQGVLVPEAPPVLRPGDVPPGMAYDPVTDTVVPIKGWQPAPNTQPGLPPPGTKLKYQRFGEKIGEVPVRR